MEATYGDPFYIFPSRHKVYAKIVEWATGQAKNGKSPVFRVYASGKAQEIVKLFNIYTTLPVMASSPVSRVNEAHEDFGVKLDYVDISSRTALKASEKVHVLVTTTRDELVSSEKSVCALATGWALKMRSRSLSFPLSNHADFRQLAEYVKATGAKKVYVYTGYIDIFSEYLSKKLGVEAKPLPALTQTELRDF